MSLPYPSLRQGLVGAWCPSLFLNGRRITDASGYSRHAFAVNTVSSRAIGLGRMAAGDGVSGYYDSFSACGLGGATAATLSMWFYRETTSSANFTNGAGAGINAGRRFAIGNVGTTFYCTAENNAGSYPSFTSSVVGLNHVATVFDGRAAVRLRAFVNGVDVGPLTAGGTATPTQLSSSLGNFRLGFDSDSNSYGAGPVDDMRVYSRALTPAEIRLLASQRGIGLRYAQHYDDDAESLQYPIATPPNRVHANVGGVWVPGQVRANEAGTWGNGETRVNQGGEWL